jgi:hypothetical protein
VPLAFESPLQTPSTGSVASAHRVGRSWGAMLAATARLVPKARICVMPMRPAMELPACVTGRLRRAAEIAVHDVFLPFR